MKVRKMSDLKRIFLFLLYSGLNVNVNMTSWSARMKSALRENYVPTSLVMRENLASGLKLAMEHCKRQFKWDPWNCPENVFSHGNRGWGSTKEFAYVLAITSAAIDYVVIKNCSSGSIKGCGCNPNLNGQQDNFVWGGCSDYPEYGEEASKKFLDEEEVGMDAHTYTNLHNYAIGREVVRKSMKKHCKCHGMSGSCTVQSCWMQLGLFSDIAAQLKTRYDRAIRFDFQGKGKYAVGNSVSGNSLESIPKANTKYLMYLQKSPNYCRENNTTGWKGTKGRTCSRKKTEGVTTSERKSCRNLCKICGYEVRRKERTIEQHCNCTFQWCCEVKCERCNGTLIEHFCS